MFAKFLSLFVYLNIFFIPAFLADSIPLSESSITNVFLADILRIDNPLIKPSGKGLGLNHINIEISIHIFFFK